MSMTATQVSKAMRLRAYYEQGPMAITSKTLTSREYRTLATSIRPENLAEDGVLTSVPLEAQPSSAPRPRPSNRAARPDVDVPFAV